MVVFFWLGGGRGGGKGVGEGRGGGGLADGKGWAKRGAIYSEKGS